MLKKIGYNQNLASNGVIFIEVSDSSEESCFTAKQGNDNKKTYWFHKYLQDLQNRGISRKIIRQP